MPSVKTVIGIWHLVVKEKNFWTSQDIKYFDSSTNNPKYYMLWLKFFASIR